MLASSQPTPHKGVPAEADAPTELGVWDLGPSRRGVRRCKRETCGAGTVAFKPHAPSLSQPTPHKGVPAEADVPAERGAQDLGASQREREGGGGQASPKEDVANEKKTRAV
jgi:hypothetical protein